MEAGFPRTLVAVILWWCVVVVVQGGFSFYKTIHHSDWYQVRIPRPGIYMVMLTVDPYYLQNEHLDLARYTYLGAYGDYLISGLTVALPMRAGLQSVVQWSSSRRNDFEDATALSVVYVSDLSEGYYVLVRLMIYEIGPTRFYSARTASEQTVTFNYWMDQHGYWTSQVHSTFLVQQSGIHWVSARPDPSIGIPVRVDIMNGDRVLFTVWAENGQAISTSGAYYLERHSHVSMKVPKFKRLYAATLLSFAFLAHNGRNASSDHIAWTSYVDQTSAHTYSQGETVMFGGRWVMTDYGSLYHSATRNIVINVSGSYLISIRMDPGCRMDPDCELKGVLYLNRSPKWSVWAEGGVPSGQAVALPLRSGDNLHLKAEVDRDVDLGTMMSIAFVAP